MGAGALAARISLAVVVQHCLQKAAWGATALWLAADRVRIAVPTVQQFDAPMYVGACSHDAPVAQQINAPMLMRAWPHSSAGEASSAINSWPVWLTATALNSSMSANRHKQLACVVYRNRPKQQAVRHSQLHVPSRLRCRANSIHFQTRSLRTSPADKLPLVWGTSNNGTGMF